MKIFLSAIEGQKEIPQIFAGKMKWNLMSYYAIRKNTALAETLLPTTSGFFFGSANYDQWYYEDVKQTYEKLGEIIEADEFDEYNFYYESSW